MKDSYSFDLDAAGLDVSFERHRIAYLEIFRRLSVPVIPVEASSGAMGGKDSTEFMSPSEVGEDLVAHCPACNYAANVEKATSRLAEVADGPGLPAPEQFATPGVRIGLFCTTPMVALTRAVGRKRAMEMLLTGDFVDAKTAAEWGLVNRVTPPDMLVEVSQQLLEAATRGSFISKGIGKQAYYAQIDLPQE